MKKYFLFLLCLFFAIKTIAGLPTIVINNTPYPTDFLIQVQKGKEKIDEFSKLAYHAKWELPANSNYVMSIVWADPFSKTSYKIENPLKQIKQGGTVIISKEGQYMIDAKKGKLDFGKAEIIGKID